MEDFLEELDMKKVIKRVIIGIVLVFALILGMSCVHIIPTGYTGVRTTFGLINEEPVQSGRLFFTIPFVEHISKVNNKQQEYQVENKIWGETNDKTPVYAGDVVVTYQIASERSAWIYANVSHYDKSLITDNLVGSAAKSAMVELGPNEVTNRAKIEPLIQQKLTESVDVKYGEGTIRINKVVVGDMDFEKEYNQAIKAKSIASQKQAKATIENQTAIEKAEAKKKVTILNAEADAEQVRIAAEAEAEANHLIQESLTPTLIEKKKIEAWDGKLPVVSGNATSFINLDSLTKETKTKESEK